MKWLAVFLVLFPSFCFASDFFTHKPTISSFEGHVHPSHTFFTHKPTISSFEGHVHPSHTFFTHKPTISSFEGHVHPSHTFFTHKSSKGGQKGSSSSSITTSSGTTLNINVNTSPSGAEREIINQAQSTDLYDDGYDDGQENQGQWSDKESYLDGFEDAQRDNQQGVTIHGEWDTRGTHYTPAGQGNKWRQDGTFMQKAAGGYIDTKTGQFIPSTE